MRFQRIMQPLAYTPTPPADCLLWVVSAVEIDSVDPATNSIGLGLPRSSTRYKYKPHREL